MPSRPCPICQADAPRVLEGPLSDMALVIYYRCDACGHVWYIPKHDPDAPSVVVTDDSEPKP